MILVFVETTPGSVEETSLETLTLARSLSAEGGGVPVHAVLVGGEVIGGEVDDAVRDALAEYAVSRVYAATSPDLAAYSGAGWASAIEQVRAQAGSVVVMAAGTPRGMELMAHVAARTGVPMAANVVSFQGLAPFLVTRQVMGGGALEQMRLGHRPAVFTVAGHALMAAPAATRAAAEVVEVQVEIAPRDLRAVVVAGDGGGGAGGDRDETEGLKSARVVIGAGRGAGGPDGFDGVLELAELLHGSLGVSRVVTSLGWRPHHEQVGQTGSRVSPELYVACGISGAIQHWAGMSSSKTIVAINTDPEAPMVTKAHYAVIGDMHQVVPAVVEEIRTRRG